MRVTLRALPLMFAALPVLATPSSGQAIAWSQYGSVTQKLGATEIEVRYRRPVARGRELFGNLVKWDEVWAPGADSATTIRFSTDVLVDSNSVPAGTYSIWMIPRQQEWTLILSRAWQVYHRPYPEGQDELRLTLTPTQGQHMETLTFHFPVVDGPKSVLALQWGKTIVEIPIEIAVEW